MGQTTIEVEVSALPFLIVILTIALILLTFISYASYRMIEVHEMDSCHTGNGKIVVELKNGSRIVTDHFAIKILK